MGTGVAYQGVTAGLLTVLFTDIVGSTEFTVRRGDEDARATRDLHDQLVRRQLVAHGGREVQTTGDGFLVTFSSVRKAIACACAIQRAQLDHNGRYPDGALSLRVGLNAGEISRRDDGLFGSAVNLAARITAQAGPGEILISEVVKQLAGTIANVEFRDRGRFHLRGFPDRWRLYEPCWSPQVATPALPERMAEDDLDPAARRLGDQGKGAGNPGNLPTRLSSLAGREREVSELRRLTGEARLLTIVGAGGPTCSGTARGWTGRATQRRRRRRC
jgi:class 3 adenylate cyclase